MITDEDLLNTYRKNYAPDKITLELAVDMVETWHKAKNLVDGSSDQAQFLKLMEEFGELAGDLARGRDIRDSVGDVLVVLINHCLRNETSLEECLVVAWEDIKDRKGKMVDGVFIKEADYA